MSKILLIIAAISAIISIVILITSLTSTNVEMSKIITLSTVVTAVFISTIAINSDGAPYTLGFMITYIVSQFTIILHALHLIKNEE